MAEFDRWALETCSKEIRIFSRVSLSTPRAQNSNNDSSQCEQMRVISFSEVKYTSHMNIANDKIHAVHTEVPVLIAVICHDNSPEDLTRIVSKLRVLSDSKQWELRECFQIV